MVSTPVPCICHIEALLCASCQPFSMCVIADHSHDLTVTAAAAGYPAPEAIPDAVDALVQL